MLFRELVQGFFRVAQDYANAHGVQINMLSLPAMEDSLKGNTSDQANVIRSGLAAVKNVGKILGSDDSVPEVLNQVLKSNFDSDKAMTDLTMGLVWLHSVVRFERALGEKLQADGFTVGVTPDTSAAQTIYALDAYKSNLNGAPLFPAAKDYFADPSTDYRRLAAFVQTMRLAA